MTLAPLIRATFIVAAAPSAIGALTLVSTRGVAQEAPGVSAETFVRAAPIERSAPRYPAAALNSGKEGWVMLSYVISPDGVVTEPMIEDSSGVESLERAALDAVRKWRFTPAMRNGVPVEQSMTKTRIAFQLEDGEPGASNSFRRKYIAIAKLIDARDLASVPPLLDELEFGGRANLYEDAWFWWLKFAFLEASESNAMEEKIAALRTAVGYEEEYLAPDLFVAAAQRLYALQIRTADYSAARNTFVRLRDAKTAKRAKQYDSVLEALRPSYEKIEELIAGTTPIASNAKIGGHDYWVHDLLRRSFAMDNISGRVDVVDVRCERATKRYDTFPLDGVWRVPESWGECGVYIKGEPGTTFLFVEYPAATPATTLSD
jgi:TonB family protein